MADDLLTIHHETFGQRRPDRTPLLLVHGGAGTIQAHFGEVLSPLSADRFVVGVELQGHGHTPHADRAYTPQHNVADVVAVLDRLELGRVDVLAFSNGCLTALQLAVDVPDRVGRLVIASGFVRRDGMIEGFWEQFQNPDPAALPPELAEAYRRTAPDPDALSRMFDLDVELMRGATDWSEAELAALAAPILFLSGDRDIVRPEHTVEVARQVADGRAAIVPAGHGDYLGTIDGGGNDELLVGATVSLMRQFLDGKISPMASPAGGQ